MKINIYKWFLFLIAGVFVGCNSDDDAGTGEPIAEEITSGTADFSQYVALGNSLTAGYTDGALFIAGQQNSIPNILAEQFELAGGGEFSQPLMNDNIGGLLFQGTVIEQPRLIFDGSGAVRLPATPTTEVTAGLSGPFNNMGVPGAKTYHLLAPGYGNPAGVPTGQSNPYFVRFASSPSATVIGDAVGQNPTFFSLWIGLNDVLNFAASGGDGTNQNGNTDPSTYGGNDITDPNVFAQVYSGLVSSLVANGAEGVVANIPNVIKIPYFNTVPYNPVPLDAQTAAGVSQAYAQYNGGLQQALAGGLINAEEAAARTIAFTEGRNAVVIEDESLTDLSGLGLPSIRQATEEDLLVLPSSAFIGTTVEGNAQMINGVTVPLGDKWILLPSEQQDVISATEAFNATIRAVAQQNELAFVDVNGILNEVAESGVDFDEYSLNTQFLFGGAFSLDGVHPTARGYAYLANKFIEEINETYGSNLPLVRAVNYNTLYPASLP